MRAVALKVNLPFAPGDQRPWVLMARQVARDIESGALVPGDRVTMTGTSGRIYRETGRSIPYTEEREAFAYLLDAGIIRVARLTKNTGARIYVIAEQPGDADGAGTWRDEPWARHVSGLARPDRMTLISAACLIMEHEGNLPDALESQLTVFLECACGTDLEPRTYDLLVRPQDAIGNTRKTPREMLRTIDAKLDKLLSAEHQ